MCNLDSISFIILKKKVLLILYKILFQLSFWGKEEDFYIISYKVICYTIYCGVSNLEFLINKKDVNYIMDHQKTIFRWLLQNFDSITPGFWWLRRFLISSHLETIISNSSYTGYLIRTNWKILLELKCEMFIDTK
jgi:hypothetical protein